MDEKPQVIVVVRCQPTWLSVAQLILIVLFGLAAASVTWFFLTVSAALMRFLEGVGGP